MRIIKPSATYMEHNVAPYEFVEKVGRTCYKSEDRITEGSAEKFVKSLINSNHWAMLEHETLYIAMTESLMMNFLRYMTEQWSENLAFFNITYDVSGRDYILSGSFRSFHDLFSKDYQGLPIKMLKYSLQCSYPLVFGEPDAKMHYSYTLGYDCTVYSREVFISLYRSKPDILFKHLTHTVKFVCDRGVSHEMVRHRVASFAQESTRYCNYSKDKYGNEITVILPCFFTGKLPYDLRFDVWRESCEVAESKYFELLKMKATPQEARTVLPNSLKTELIITTTEEEWQHIVNLRLKGTTGSPHPQMKESMALIIDDLLKESEGRISYEAD